ncbi:MAG: hypothetical protein M3238_05740 [Actinomycetota bacterium]|nr:hypothetical protein [Actinomycetota bacterium]
MEIEGHPTQDLLEELERRGAVRMNGTTAGPRTETLRFLTEQIGDVPGLWLFMPRETFLTGLDDPLV